MRRLSRHLPPAPEKQTTLCGWIVMIGILAGLITGVVRLIFWIIANPLQGILVLLLVFLAILYGIIITKQMTRRMRKLVKDRAGDSICTFRRAFDLRRVDPWIVRATYQELQNYFSGYGPNFSIRATDRLEEDLEMDSEDLEDLGETVAARAGYDLTDTQTNPLLGKVATVGDFVLFFTYQPCRRLS